MIALGRNVAAGGACALALLFLAAGEREGPFAFQNVAAKSGINFVLENSPTPRKYMIETMPGGVAVFDYNGDGLPDIYFTNGAAVPSLDKTDPKFWNRLYRNDGGMRFTDVTAQAGVAGQGYSMGVAAGDYDNDGHPDLFVAGVNRNTLYHNRGDGTFEDVTEKAGIKSGEWAVAAGWFDYDNDGKLDLIVIHYSSAPLQDRFCGDRERSIRIYCHPKYFDPLPATLYHNRGDGTFEDVSEKSGIARVAGRGMSVAFADYDGDGFMDVFVTNDNMPNFLFHNLGNGNVRRGRSDRWSRSHGSRPAGLEHGRGFSRLRQRWPSRYQRHRARGRDLSALPQSRQRPFHRCDLCQPPRSIERPA